MITKADYSLY